MLLSTDPGPLRLWHQTAYTSKGHYCVKKYSLWLPEASKELWIVEVEYPLAVAPPPLPCFTASKHDSNWAFWGTVMQRSHPYFFWESPKYTHTLLNTIATRQTCKP